MELIPRDFQHKKTQLKALQFATAASGIATAKGTGLIMVPVYFQISASALGSAAIYQGTSGSEIFRFKFGAGAPVCGPLWENPNNMAANKALLLEVEGAVGVGQFNVWYIVVRGGAGGGGTTQ